MGGAIAVSLNDSGYNVAVTAATENSIRKISALCPDAEGYLSNRDATRGADIVVLAVKPYLVKDVLEEIAPELSADTVLISVAAGISVDSLSNMVSGKKLKDIFRVIPNTAIRLGKSTTFIACSPEARKETLEEVTAIFRRSGNTFIVPEKDMAACTALSSCGIAYFLRFIRAAAEGSVELGLRPGFATEVAASTAIGAAALLEDGSHPEAEIDKVTTPGGLTIKGLNALENNGFTKAVIAALKASV